MNIAILVKMKCKRFKSSSLIMSVVHSKRRKRNKKIGYVEAFSSFLNAHENHLSFYRAKSKPKLCKSIESDTFFPMGRTPVRSSTSLLEVKENLENKLSKGKVREVLEILQIREKSRKMIL